MNRNALHLHLPPFVILLFLSLTSSPFFYLLSISFFLPFFFLSSFPPLLLLFLSHHENEYLGLQVKIFCPSIPLLISVRYPASSFLLFPFSYFLLFYSFSLWNTYFTFVPPYPLRDSLQRHLKNGRYSDGEQSSFHEEDELKDRRKERERILWLEEERNEMRTRLCSFLSEVSSNQSQYMKYISFSSDFFHLPVWSGRCKEIQSEWEMEEMKDFLTRKD